VPRSARDKITTGTPRLSWAHGQGAATRTGGPALRYTTGTLIFSANPCAGIAGISDRLALAGTHFDPYA
jgi:hypothetical protein